MTAHTCHGTASDLFRCLHADAQDKRKELSFTQVQKDEALVPAWEAEGRNFTSAYLRDAQFVFNRVQHHVHHKQADGTYLPLNSCKPKTRRGKKSRQSRLLEVPKEFEDVIEDIGQNCADHVLKEARAIASEWDPEKEYVHFDNIPVYRPNGDGFILHLSVRVVGATECGLDAVYGCM